MTFRSGRLPASPWYCIYSGTRAGVLTLFPPVYSNSSLIKPRSGCCGLRSNKAKKWLLWIAFSTQTFHDVGRVRAGALLEIYSRPPGKNHCCRQSQPSRRGCWELQDEPFTFFRRCGIASISSTGFSACSRSVFCCVRPSRNEKHH